VLPLAVPAHGTEVLVEHRREGWPAMGARTMTIKTLAAVIGTLAIIVVLFFITKITTPSRLVAKSGFFAGSSTDDWGHGTGATGFWEPIRVEGRQEQMPQ
jgi:hypothetical protein